MRNTLALHSKTYRETNCEQVNTIQGEMISSFKYHDELWESERNKIAQNFAKQVFNLIKKELRLEFPDPKNPLFYVYLGLPKIKILAGH